MLLDYEDYLRQRGHRQWDKNDPEALAVRVVGRQLDQSDLTDQNGGNHEHRRPKTARGQMASATPGAIQRGGVAFDDFKSTQSAP